MSIVLLRSTATDAREYGATGDGTTDDTAAINAALAAPGAKRVVLGGKGLTYRGDGVTIPSGVTLDLGGNTLKGATPDSSPIGVVQAQFYSGYGSVTTAGAITTVAPMQEGAFVGIRYGGKSRTQRAVTVGTGTSSSSTLTITADSPNWYAASGHIWVGTELIAYSTYTQATGVFAGLTRGAFGTTAASWANGATVSQAVNLMGYNIGGKFVPMTRVASQGGGDQMPVANLSTISFTYGAMNAGLENGTLDGNRRSHDTYYIGLSVYGARWFRVDGVHFYDHKHAGIQFSNSADCSIVDSNFSDIGVTATNFGGCLWLFGHVYNTRVERNRFSGVISNGIILDNQTSGSNPTIDGPCGFNIVRDNLIHMADTGPAGCGVVIDGECSHNTIDGNTITDAVFGVLVSDSPQGSMPVLPSFNVVTGNTIVRATTGVNVADSADSSVSGNTYADCDIDEVLS